MNHISIFSYDRPHVIEGLLSVILRFSAKFYIIFIQRFLFRNSYCPNQLHICIYICEREIAILFYIMKPLRAFQCITIPGDNNEESSHNRMMGSEEGLHHEEILL
jgi:hypothetical protein